MATSLSPPRTDPQGLDDLELLWTELHAHHRAVADYRDLVEDPDVSWQRRRRWYRRLLDDGAAYIVARVADRDRPVGYAMVTFSPGPDDTFASPGGIAEIVSLVVTDRYRARGLGTALLGAAEEWARAQGADAVRIAVMAGNTRAGDFYRRQGYAVAEHLLYRRLTQD